MSIFSLMPRRLIMSSNTKVDRELLIFVAEQFLVFNDENLEDKS